MDASFYLERAELVRDLAGKADPFTEKRLLILAAKYEQQASKPIAPIRPPQPPRPLAQVRRA